MQSFSLKPKTIYLDLCALRSFIKYLVIFDSITNDPCTKIVRSKLPSTKPNPLRDDEIERFFNSINRSTTEGQCNYVLFQLALKNGLRATKLISLSIYDISLSEGILYFRHSKGDKDRIVPLSSALCYLLEHYMLHTRPMLVHATHCDIFFVTNTHKPLWSNSPRLLALKYRKEAGLTYRQVSPHVFRYTFATLHSRKAKADITVIKELLGHSNIHTTARYVGVAEENKRKAVELLDS